MIIFKLILEDLKKKSRLKVLKILFKEVKTIFFKKNLYTIFSSFLGLVQVVHLNPLGSKWSYPYCSKVISFALIHDNKQFHNNSTTIFMREGEGNSTRTITDLNQWMITFYLLLLLLLLLLFLIIIIILWKRKYLDWVRFLLIYIYIYI